LGGTALRLKFGQAENEGAFCYANEDATGGKPFGPARL